MVWALEGLIEVDGEVLKVGLCDGCTLNDGCSLILANGTDSPPLPKNGLARS